MQQLISEQTVIDAVTKATAETLNIDASTITPDSSLIKDLGAESLDFLDINYRLEQAFGIKMARHFILEHIEEMFGEGSALDENSQLTDKAVALLRLRLGDLPELRPGMDMDEVPPLVTIRSLAKGVVDILDSLPAQCPACGGGWKVEEGTHVICAACGTAAAFANGDDLIKEWLANVQKEKGIF